MKRIALFRLALAVTLRTQGHSHHSRCQILFLLECDRWGGLVVRATLRGWEVPSLMLATSNLFLLQPIVPIMFDVSTLRKRIELREKMVSCLGRLPPWISTFWCLKIFAMSWHSSLRTFQLDLNNFPARWQQSKKVSISKSFWRSFSKKEAESLSLQSDNLSRKLIPLWWCKKEKFEIDLYYFF